MIIGVFKERANEHRVAMTPEVMICKRLTETILLESGAGERAGFSNDSYGKAGARIETSRGAILSQAQVIFSIGLPDEAVLDSLRPGTCLIGQLRPFQNAAFLERLAVRGVSAFALETVPRTTRAQAMDILSSQSNLAGYQAIVEAAAQLGRAFPLMMTAAGSVPAARVLIVGAGVAGLQAIATAKRLGAIVSAFDVRASAKEQVESLGATFIEVPSDESGEGSGGYAREMSSAYKAAQEKRLLEVIADQDVVVTTAQIPNKPAPKIITETMVERMKDGALLIDLAGETGGNCALSKCGETIYVGTKRIFAPSRILNDIAPTASNLFAANLVAFMKTLLKESDEGVTFNREDELIQKTLLTFDGEIVHPLLKIKK